MIRLTTQMVALYHEVTMFRVLRKNRFLVPGIAAVAAFAFLLAINYCVCEAFSADRAHSEPSQQHSPAGHHDDNAPASQDQSDPCCATLQAVASSTRTPQVASFTLSSFPFVVLLGSEIAPRTQRAAVHSGLSPPAREPPAQALFYRTTFASHAPPARLA